MLLCQIHILSSFCLHQAIACVFPPCPPGTRRVVTQIPGVCCANVSCVNVTTCKVDGNTYNVGDEIPHKDPCVHW